MVKTAKSRVLKPALEELFHLIDHQGRSRLKAFSYGFAKLSGCLSDLQQKHKARNLSIAEEWNPFQIIRVGHLETKLHTPFLRALFDSNGGHGQGTLFFKRFLEQLAGVPGGPNHADLSLYVSNRFQSDYVCREEVFDRESGRMDLVIERRFGARAFCIIIENKIGALEQATQLQRYSSYLRKHPAPRNRCFLVYLHAFEEDHRPKSGKCSLVLRYQNHIMSMLRESEADVRAQIVKDTIRQYRAVIMASFRRIPMRNGYDAESMKVLMKPKNWKKAREIVVLMKEAEAKVIQELWLEVGKCIKQKGKLIKPQYFLNNNYKGIWGHIAHWPENVYFDIGQGLEGGRRLLYCDLGLDKTDKRSRGLLRKFKTASVGDFQFVEEGETIYIYREFTTSSEPEDWPINGKKGLIVLAEEIAKKGTDFISDANRLIKQRKRSLPIARN